MFSFVLWYFYALTYFPSPIYFSSKLRNLFFQHLRIHKELTIIIILRLKILLHTLGYQIINQINHIFYIWPYQHKFHFRKNIRFPTFSLKKKFYFYNILIIKHKQHFMSFTINLKLKPCHMLPIHFFLRLPYFIKTNIKFFQIFW